jgi:cyclic pyranopterin phosphate synthase
MDLIAIDSLRSVRPPIQRRPEINPFNALKLLRHADRIEAMLRGEMVYPISVEFDASNTCPHDCPFCSFGTSRSQGYRQQHWVQFPTDRALTLFDELHDVGVKSITFTGGGEPLVHKAIATLLEKAASLFEIGVVTNGFNLRGAARDVIAQHATFLRVSLDAGNPETHAFTHGTKTPQFHQILEHLRASREAAAGRPLTIGASFCVMDENWKEIYLAARQVKEAGGDYLEVRPTFPTEWRGDGWGHALSEMNVGAAQIEIEHAKAHLNDARFRVIGMVERFDRLSNPVKQYEKCRIGPLTTVIGADGRLWHCCVNRGIEAFCYGSVLERSFREVWDAPEHAALMARIDIRRCPRCRYDSLNEVLEGAFLKDEMHANFI